MKISPTILNSSSALRLGSVSQCALGIREGAGEGWEWDPQERGPHKRSSREGSGVVFSKESSHPEDLNFLNDHSFTIFPFSNFYRSTTYI